MIDDALRARVVRDPDRLRRECARLRAHGLRVALVPTMGALHDGHAELLRVARGRADVVVLTIFVNPRQFGPAEDLARYPRDLDGDVALARSCGVDLVFAPEAASMYPPGSQTVVRVPDLAAPLCGASRPGHFDGVATVVTKLFALVRPHLAVFGEKDFQQLAIVRRLAADLDLGVDVVGVPIVREPDGLARSSRNAYLSVDERRRALALSRALAAAERAFADGERDARALERAATAELGEVRLDYAEVRDAATLAPVDRADRPAVLAIAAYVGATRLIDNRVLSPGRIPG